MTTLDEAIETIRRTAWRPVVEEGDGEPGDSKFGGRPWIPEGGRWPTCGLCDQPAQLFVQLDLSTLPEACPHRRESGIVQLFDCTRRETQCMLECDSWEPFSANTVTRWYPDPTDAPDRTTVGPERFEFDTGTSWMPKRITGWDPVDDLPNREEWAEQLEALDIESDDFEADVDAFLDDPDHGTHEGDKLGGWPYWVQWVDYPDCPECGERMEYFFQIDSNDHLPHMFGDCGSAHLTQCSDHPNQLGFGWACF